MDAQMGSPDFWNNNERAQAHISKLNVLKRAVLPVVDFHKRLGDVDVMVEQSPLVDVTIPGYPA